MEKCGKTEMQEQRDEQRFCGSKAREIVLESCPSAVRVLLKTTDAGKSPAENEGKGVAALPCVPFIPTAEDHQKRPPKRRFRKAYRKGFNPELMYPSHSQAVHSCQGTE
ncbi:hypothetical protein INR49_023302 [Caranx melampygus]|nr:hypothetical protein INR49_023302 [Caranx melampygus]